MNKETLQSIVIISITATGTVLGMWYLVEIPMTSQAYNKAMIEFNSTNTCTGLTFLNSDLSKYDLFKTEGDYIREQIKHKAEVLKCP